jgi:hypothetical protein
MEKLVPVEIYNNYVEANIVLGRLQNDGIDCWLLDENTATILTGNTIGGIKLVVPQSQAEKAKELITTYSNEQNEPND